MWSWPARLAKEPHRSRGAAPASYCGGHTIHRHPHLHEVGQNPPAPGTLIGSPCCGCSVLSLQLSHRAGGPRAPRPQFANLPVFCTRFSQVGWWWDHAVRGLGQLCCGEGGGCWAQDKPGAPSGNTAGGHTIFPGGRCPCPG